MKTGKEKQKMYKGVGPETGKTVQEYDAFSYACEQCLTGTEEERRTFMEIAEHSEDILDFACQLTEWFYSGNWVKDTETELETQYLVEIMGNKPRVFFGTYFNALKSGYAEAKGKGVSFDVVPFP